MFRPKQLRPACFTQTCFAEGSAKTFRTGLLVVMLLSVTAMVSSNVRAQGEAHTASLLTFDIPPGQLAMALNQFARTAGIFVSGEARLTEGKLVEGLEGHYTIKQGLSRLLQSSGISYISSDSNTFTLVAAANTAATESNNAINEEPAELDTITVTGELQERSLQETQSSVVVVNGDELDRRDDFDIRDVIERTPNMTSANGELSFTIRGVEARGVSASGEGLLINVQVDGASLPNEQAIGFGPYSTWDLEQVEILRGPQSTQQGRNALAGAVIFRSADPTYDLEFKGRGEIGSRDTRGGALAVNVPIVEEKIALRLSAERKQSDGFVDAPTLGRDDYDFDKITTLRGKVLFEPTEDLSFILGYSDTDNKTGEDNIVFDQFPERRITDANEDAEEGTNIGIGNLRITWDINDNLVFESETAVLNNDYIRIEDVTGEGFGVLDLAGNSESFSEELILRYTDEKYRAVGGIYYTDISSETDTNFTIDASFINPALTGISITQTANSMTDTRNAAVFGEVEIDIPDFISGLTFIIGGRYDDEKIEFSNSSVTTTSMPFPAPLPPDETNSSDTRFDAFLPKAGLIYQWTDDLSTGLTVQRGYRAGGTFRNPITGQLSKWEPEYTWNIELAVRSQWFDERLTANANLFYTDWTDQQLLVRGPSGVVLDNNAANAGSSKLYGGELELQGRPVSSLELFAAFGVTKTEFTDFENNGEDLAGNEFSFAPKFTGAIGARYSFTNGISVGADTTYTGSYFTQVNNSSTNKVDSRSLLNLNVGYERTYWRITGYARNVLDEDYLIQQDTEENIARSGEPLTVGVFVNVDY